MSGRGCQQPIRCVSLRNSSEDSVCFDSPDRVAGSLPLASREVGTPSAVTDPPPPRLVPPTASLSASAARRFRFRSSSAAAIICPLVLTCPDPAPVVPAALVELPLVAPRSLTSPRSRRPRAMTASLRRRFRFSSNSVGGGSRARFFDPRG